MAIDDEPVSSELKRKRRYNTEVNDRYFKKHKLQQWGSRRWSGIPILIDDLDIMEREDLFDTIE